MDRAPVVVGQRNDGRTLDAGQYACNLFDTVFRSIQHHVFLVLGRTHGLEAEQHLIENPVFFFIHIPITNEHGFAFHNNFHLPKVVADEGRTAAHDVKNAIGQTDSRTDFNRARNYMNISLYSSFEHEVAKYVGIGSRNFPPIKPIEPGVVDFFRNGQTEPASAETETGNDLSVFVALHELIFSYDPNVGYTVGHTLWDIIVTQIEDFQRKVGRLH